MEEDLKPSTPDLTLGVAIADFEGGKLLGHVGDRDVLLAKSDSEIFAIDAHCTHYQGPLAKGLVVGDTIRCPWHHACFSLRSGEAMHAPAFAPLAVWDVEQKEGKVFVREKRSTEKPERVAQAMPRPRCFVGWISREASSCSATTSICRLIGPISPRIISPAPLRKTGCRCRRRTSIKTSISICG